MNYETALNTQAKVQINNRYFAKQSYDQYTTTDHLTWRTLYSRMEPLWQEYAAPSFLSGLHNLNLSSVCIPRFEPISNRLDNLAQFHVKGVHGYLPELAFFQLLAERKFPVNVNIRRLAEIDFSPEPDIFHEMAGHLPMLTNTTYAELLLRFGEMANLATGLATTIKDQRRRELCLMSSVTALSRFFWFTVEVGLLFTGGEFKAYGSALLTSHSELSYSLCARNVQRYPAQMQWLINQSFDYAGFQPLLFYVESIDQLHELMSEFEQMLLEGQFIPQSLAA